jgi:hypothetical protein
MGRFEPERKGKRKSAAFRPHARRARGLFGNGMQI